MPGDDNWLAAGPPDRKSPDRPRGLAGGGLQTALWKKRSFLRVLCSPPRPRERQPALDRLFALTKAGPRRAHALLTSDPAVPPALDRLRNPAGRLQAALWENMVFSKGRLQPLPPGGWSTLGWTRSKNKHWVLQEPFDTVVVSLMVPASRMEDVDIRPRLQFGEPFLDRLDQHRPG